MGNCIVQTLFKYCSIYSINNVVIIALNIVYMAVQRALLQNNEIENYTKTN